MNDLRLIADNTIAVIVALLLRALAIMAMETYIKPALIWIGERTYRRADALSGDRLPDLFDDTIGK